MIQPFTLVSHERVSLSAKYPPTSLAGNCRVPCLNQVIKGNTTPVCPDDGTRLPARVRADLEPIHLTQLTDRWHGIIVLASWPDPL